MKEWELQKYVDGTYTLDYPAETMENTVIICKIEPYCSFEQDKQIKPLIENAPNLLENYKLMLKLINHQGKNVSIPKDFHAKTIKEYKDLLKHWQDLINEIEGDKD